MPSFDEQMGKLLEAATEIGTKVIGSAIENGPQAMDMILWTYRYDGITTIVQGIGAVVISFLLSIMCKSAFEKTNNSDSIGPVLVAIMSGVGFCFMSVGAIACLFDKWAWAAAIDPKLYMAHVILSKIGG